MRRSLLCALVLVAASPAGCSGGDDPPPDRLLDGSSSRPAPVGLDDVGRAVVLTRVRMVPLDEVGPGTSACLQRYDERPAAPVVERVGVDTETVTARSASGTWLLGCDNSFGPREGSRRWCGVAVGRLYAGRLRDPRIDIGCTTADGELVGFAWVYPTHRARYIVVGQPGYAEVYESAAGLPIRVATTTGVIVEGSRARFDISEHDRDGNLVRRYELDAPVAG